MPCSMDQASSPRASSAPTPICTTTTTVSLCKHRSTVIVSWQILTVAHGACLRTHRPTVASWWGLYGVHICQCWVVAAFRAGGALDCTLNYKCVWLGTAQQVCMTCYCQLVNCRSQLLQEPMDIRVMLSPAHCSCPSFMQVSDIQIQASQPQTHIHGPTHACV